MNRQSNTFLHIGLATALSFCSTALAAESGATQIMPLTQQNAVVKKQCASCHSDELMYGGLSLEHFDAAHADPTLAAMLVSKITNGYTPKEVLAAVSPERQAKILALMKMGAMTAGGPLPDNTTQLALARALSLEAAGAEKWHIERSNGPQGQSHVLTATALQQLPSIKFGEGKTDMYRLILTCRIPANQGEIKLTWANGVPEEGREINVAVDSTASFTHKVEGGRKQGNGANGPGATILRPGNETKMLFPRNSLTISNVFADETVSFSFEDLGQTDHRDLSACFER